MDYRYIYFLYEKGTFSFSTFKGLFKIGISKHKLKRVNTLNRQIGNIKVLIVVKIFFCQAIEWRLHQELKKFRTTHKVNVGGKSEWFNLSPIKAFSVFCELLFSFCFQHLVLVGVFSLLFLFLFDVFDFQLLLSKVLGI